MENKKLSEKFIEKKDEQNNYAGFMELTDIETLIEIVKLETRRFTFHHRNKKLQDEVQQEIQLALDKIAKEHNIL